jgi:hypothetical protein
MVLADDIFGGLVALDDDTSEPGQGWATMPPFECTEEPIEHATDLSPNTSYEADRDLHNPKKRRGKGKTNLTAAEIRERKNTKLRETRARKASVQQQQVAVRDLADRAVKMESAAIELANKADAKLKEAHAYVESNEATRELRRAQAEYNAELAESELKVTAAQVAAKAAVRAGRRESAEANAQRLGETKNKHQKQMAELTSVVKQSVSARKKAEAALCDKATEAEAHAARVGALATEKKGLLQQVAAARQQQKKTNKKAPATVCSTELECEIASLQAEVRPPPPPLPFPALVLCADPPRACAAVWRRCR